MNFWLMILAGLGFVALFILAAFLVLLMITKIRVHAIYNQPDEEPPQREHSLLEALEKDADLPPDKKKEI